MPLDPPNDPQSYWSLIPHIAWAAFAVVGGVARYLDEAFRGGKGFRPLHLVTTAFISGFSGYMVAQLALKVNPSWALIAAGVGGYLGTQAMDEIRKILFTYLSRGVASEQRREEKDKDADADAERRERHSDKHSHSHDHDRTPPRRR
jgi:hypothetical protein